MIERRPIAVVNLLENKIGPLQQELCNGLVGLKTWINGQLWCSAHRLL